MRKPSALKILIDNKVGEYSKKYIVADSKEEKEKCEEVLRLLFMIQDICNNRKKY